jgi:hypothetical protein
MAPSGSRRSTARTRRRPPRGAGELLDRLSRSSEPSIRWKLQVRVLGRDRGSPRVARLEEEIRRSPRVRALLARRAELGRPGTLRHVYYKWQGIHWVLASLADLGYPAGDESLAPLRDRLLELWLRPSYFREFDPQRRPAGSPSPSAVPLLRGRYRRCASQQGNVLYSLQRLGLADARAEPLVERLLHWQWPDGGWNCDPRPEADTSSFMETLLPMLGLAEYGRANDDARAVEGARRASEVFLRRRLYRRVHDGRVIRPEFVALHYPLYYHYDVLGGLRSMIPLGRIRDPRCADALDLLEGKRLEDGGWPAERRYYRGHSLDWGAGVDYVDWGGVGARKTNEWVSVDALSVLVAAGRIAI